ncbi:MAG: acyl carrier protein [Pseudomonadota bacterium]|nr:acyl carrier protein [Pseudomonadota bacterium]
MNTTEAVITLVKELVEPRFHERVTPEAELLQSRLVDSFGLIQLVGDIEARFGITISTEELTMQNFSTVSGIVALVEHLRGRGDGQP